MEWRRLLPWLLGAPLALLAAAVAARRAGLEPALVRGDSMLPTLAPGQRIAAGRLDRAPRRGELVVVRRPGELEVVKRVVALPGERARLSGGRLTVDGRPLAEPYALAGGAGELEVALGPGEYLVLGDHRAASSDSRAFGPVRREHLTGVVRFAYWPPRPLR